MAELLTERSDSLMAYFVGSRIAERAGWPAERLAALREERKRFDAGTQLLLKGYDAEQPYSCRTFEHMERIVPMHAEIGEVETLRRLAPAPPR